MLIFPQNVSNAHWNLYIVFNPSHIMNNIKRMNGVDGDENNKDFFSCILFFDSIGNKYGRIKHRTDFTDWIYSFLNLKFAEDDKQEKTEDIVVNNDSFPLFQIKSRQQPDGWSCGYFSIRSIIAIVSRSGEFLPFTYNELLRKDIISYKTEILNVTKDVSKNILFRHFQC